jgi:hypothetical protein
VNLATSAKTVGAGFSAMFQSSAEPLKPATNTTVGDPLPRHSKYILRPPPMSTRPVKSPLPVAALTNWTPRASLRNLYVATAGCLNSSQLQTNTLRVGSAASGDQNVRALQNDLRPVPDRIKFHPLARFSFDA